MIFIGVLVARACCGCGYAEYEVVHREEECALLSAAVTYATHPHPAAMWNNADIKQINPAEIVLGERIGKGSFGQVFRGTWRGTQVAVKKLNMPMLVDDSFVREFKNEIDVMRYSVPTHFESAVVDHCCCAGECRTPTACSSLAQVSSRRTS